MSIPNNIQQYLKDNKDLIINNDWEKFFKGIPLGIGYYLYTAGVPFLYQMNNIPNYCFTHTALEKINIPNNVTTIGKSAFYGCKSLTSIMIPSRVTNISEDAFYYCDGLTGVYIADLAAWCNINFSNHSANPLYYAKNLYLNNSLVTDLVIPSTVTSISDYAFHNCSSLTSITIPNSVISIGEYAFAGEYGTPMGLVSVTFAKGIQLTSIGYAAFSSCASLTSIEIPTSVISIDTYAFYNCSSLKSITIPNSVTNIGELAFGQCDKIEINYTGTREQWVNIYNTKAFQNTSILVHCTDGDFVKNN